MRSCCQFMRNQLYGRRSLSAGWAMYLLSATPLPAQPLPDGTLPNSFNRAAVSASFDLPEHAAVESIPTPLTLADLEQLALQNNPTLSIAAANVTAARGRQTQGGLKPNPQVGYVGMDIGEDDTAGQHGGFVRQEFVTGGKLRLNRAVGGQEVREMRYRFSAQELRVLNDVRARFYDALVAQKNVELTDELRRVSKQLADSSRRLLEGQQVSQSDLLQAEIEAEETGIATATARNQQEEAWRRLAAVVGIAADEQRSIAGSLDDEIPSYTWDEAYTRVLAENPALAAASARARKARLAIERARRENIPNVQVMASVSHMFQTDDDVAGVQVGIPIPVCNQNQGNILAAEAELIAAENGVRRLELELQDRLAIAFRRYATARQQTERYRQEILPRAQSSLDLVGTGYREGQVDFQTLLTSQRTYIRVNLAYIAALAELRQAVTVIEGQLLTDSFQSP
jgi:outer membrane protein, heavy metal efflux system